MDSRLLEGTWQKFDCIRKLVANALGALDRSVTCDDESS